MRRWLGTFACCFLLAGSATAEPVKTLTFHTEDLPPYNMLQNGRVTGISSEIIAAALSHLQIGFELRLVTWKRAYHEAQTAPEACVYSTVRTPEREALFQWIGPIARDSLAIFVLPASAIQAHSLAELKGLRTVVTPGDYAESQLRENNIQIIPTPAEKQLSMMVAGRIDFWVANRTQAQSEARQAGIPPLRELFSYDDFELYLACNRAMPPEVIERANAEIKQLWDSGEAARITARYTTGR